MNRPSVRKIVDLTHWIDPRLVGAEVQPFKSIETDGWRATMLHLYSHCGTHMDAPCHFLPDGETLDQLNLQANVGAARIVNLSPVEPAELLTVERFQSALNEPLQPGERLLLRTDWYKRYPQLEYRDKLPRISLELAHWFVERQVRLLGVEPPSVADVNHRIELTDVHQTLFRGGVVIVEGLANLDQVNAPHCEFVALPLRILEGDGCPVRAIAILPGDEPTATEAFGFTPERTTP